MDETNTPINERRIYLPQDEDGKILNPTTISHISNEDRESLATITDTYMACLSGNLHSLYVRGTTVRESKYKPLDIDTFAITHRLIPRENREELNRRLSALSLALGTRIDDSTIERSSLNTTSKIGYYRCFEMKTQSLCIYGDDLSVDLQDFFVSHELAYMLLDDIPLGIEKTLKKLALANSSNEKINIISKQMKRSLRGGHLLILNKIGRFSRDVETCAADLTSVYPEQSALFESFLKGAVGLSSEIPDASILLEQFNIWYSGAHSLFLEERLSLV